VAGVGSGAAAGAGAGAGGSSFTGVGGTYLALRRLVTAMPFETMKFPFLMATLLLTGFLAAPAAAAAAGAPPLSPAPPAPPSALAFSSLTPSPSAAFAAAASSFSFTDASCADAAMAATAGRMEEESNRESTVTGSLPSWFLLRSSSSSLRMRSLRCRSFSFKLSSSGGKPLSEVPPAKLPPPMAPRAIAAAVPPLPS